MHTKYAVATTDFRKQVYRFSKVSELCVPTYIISTYFVMNFVEIPIKGLW